ncbi:YigZ family protein [Streptomyces sp. NBC_01803]|uniref:YigZ family protein n=1 Tax=Streptomyces sp. NBC_01803 TaxID=2975946 RepID=UPI002DDA86D8|nr:YigZ family protein [Streptomyces sp. NBC_01803]WSA47366.1 YigZ family protein [Streptomyces sp. NBC_01803]
MREGYLTVAGEGEHETEVSRSRFICSLAPAATEAEAEAFIARVRARRPDATHHCFAYVIGADAGVQRGGDDGEPGGTAGPPMLQMLLRREVRYAVAVVTRYFGGTKLGAGGLIRAYGGAVGAALDALGTVARRRLRVALITADHGRAGRLENDLRATGRAVRAVTYGAEVIFEVGLPEADVEAFRHWLAGATAGAARLELGGETYDGTERPARNGRRGENGTA